MKRYDTIYDMIDSDSDSGYDIKNKAIVNDQTIYHFTLYQCPYNCTTSSRYIKDNHGGFIGFIEIRFNFWDIFWSQYMIGFRL